MKVSIDVSELEAETLKDCETFYILQCRNVSLAHELALRILAAVEEQKAARVLTEIDGVYVPPNSTNSRCTCRSSLMTCPRHGD